MASGYVILNPLAHFSEAARGTVKFEHRQLNLGLRITESCDEDRRRGI